jgi:hypothetical protein
MQRDGCGKVRDCKKNLRNLTPRRKGAEFLFVFCCLGVRLPICIAEVVWLLNFDWRTQNEFLLDVAKQLYKCQQLLPQDFSRIAELNTQYRDLPGDFAEFAAKAVASIIASSGSRNWETSMEVIRHELDNCFTIENDSSTVVSKAFIFA